MIYNVLVPVVALVDADSPEAAERELRASLSRHGFDPFDGTPDLVDGRHVVGVDSFVSDDQTATAVLP